MSKLFHYKKTKILGFVVLIGLKLLCQPYISCGQVDTIFSSSPKYSGNYFSNNLPTSEPLLFAENLIDPKIHHFHSSPVFNADMTEMYFSMYPNYQGPQQIFLSRKNDNTWSTPEALPFLAGYSSGGPILSPDDLTLYFNSVRPDISGDSALKKSRIWFVKKKEGAWGEPKLLPLDTTLGTSFYTSHYSTDEKFYFAVNNLAPLEFSLYQCKMDNGQPTDIYKLKEPINLKGGITDGMATNPSNSLLIYHSVSGENFEHSVLNVRRKQPNGEWGDPEPLSQKIQMGHARFAAFSPDGKYFFFTSYRDGNERIYWIESQYIFD